MRLCSCSHGSARRTNTCNRVSDGFLQGNGSDSQDEMAQGMAGGLPGRSASGHSLTSRGFFQGYSFRARAHPVTGVLPATTRAL